MLLFEKLLPFESIIKKCNIKIDTIDSGLEHKKFEIIFIDNTVLHVNEVIIPEDFYFKYSYQWQNPNNLLIIRWDNSYHEVYRHIPTFPHHKHIQTDENVIESTETDLIAVLTYISKNIPNS
jgi:hypothetical protein